MMTVIHDTIYVVIITTFGMYNIRSYLLTSLTHAELQRFGPNIVVPFSNQFKLIQGRNPRPIPDPFVSKIVHSVWRYRCSCWVTVMLLVTGSRFPIACIPSIDKPVEKM